MRSQRCSKSNHSTRLANQESVESRWTQTPKQRRFWTGSQREICQNTSKIFWAQENNEIVTFYFNGKIQNKQSSWNPISTSSTSATVPLRSAWRSTSDRPSRQCRRRQRSVGRIPFPTIPRPPRWGHPDWLAASVGGMRRAGRTWREGWRLRQRRSLVSSPGLPPVQKLEIEVGRVRFASDLNEANGDNARFVGCGKTPFVGNAIICWLSEAMVKRSKFSIIFPIGTRFDVHFK